MYQPLHMNLSQLEFTRVVLHTITGHTGAKDMGKSNKGALRKDVQSGGQNRLTCARQWKVWKCRAQSVWKHWPLSCVSFCHCTNLKKTCSYFAKFGTSKAFISVPGNRAAFWSRSTYSQGVMRVNYQEAKGDSILLLLPTLKSHLPIKKERSFI